MDATKRHILITGLPGVGKTTLIREIGHRLKDYAPVGFYTKEIRVEGVRKGFRLICLDGREQTLSHVDYRSPYRVSRYGVDVATFERLLSDLDLCNSESPLIVIDEIGKMECYSARFQEIVRTVLDSSRTVLATIALKGDGLITSVKQRPDCQLINVTVEKRNELADSLTNAIMERLRKAH